MIARFTPLVPESDDGLVFIGGGRNAHNLIGIMEGAGIRVSRVLDDAPKAPVLGREVERIDDLEGQAVDAFLTITDPGLAPAVRSRSALAGCRWPTFRHPISDISPYALIGPGCFVGPFAYVTDVVMGQHVHLFAHNVLGSEVEIGDFTAILPHATLASGARIGARCVIAMGARIHAGVTIGDDCRIAANAVVRHDVPAGSMVAPERSRVRPRLAFRSKVDKVRRPESLNRRRDPVA